MLAILNVVLPVFGIILAGYLCGRFRLLGEASSEALNRFVYFLALPALFFISTARVGVGDVLNWRFLAGYGGGVVVTAAVAVLGARRLFPNRLAALGLHGLAAIFANTGYMGIPLLVTAFGPAAALPAIIATVLNGAVIMAVGIFIVEIDLSRDRGAGGCLRCAPGGRQVRSCCPPPAASSARAWASSCRKPSPASATSSAPRPGGPVRHRPVPGRPLAHDRLRRDQLARAPCCRQPLVTAAIVFALAPMGAWGPAALPTGSLVFVLAQQYGVYVERSTAAILVSTVLSVVTLFALFALLGVG
jgi:predicted permease